MSSSKPEPGGAISPDAAIDEAVAVLRRGGLVAFPTETVYGLGADARSPSAVRRVFTVKGRPPTHPVIVHLADAAALERWAAGSVEQVRTLGERFWPGPLTVIVPRAASVPDEVTGGRDTVGLRVPDHPLALALLRAFGGGLAAPSANRFGRVSPTTAAHVRDELGSDVDLVLDGGRCAVGVESTIVDLSADTPLLRRRGAIGPDEIAAVLGGEVDVWEGSSDAARSVAPGTLASHYAPRARVLLEDDPAAAASAAGRAASGGARVALLAPHVVGSLDPTVIELEPAGDGPHFARVLYDRLREADRLGVDLLWVVPPAGGGIAAAVRDRLRRAAH